MKKNDITNELRKRFCKDANIPIAIFEFSLFQQQIDLFNAQYDTHRKYDDFVEDLKAFETEQDYFEHYNNVKDKAIESIKNSAGYKLFNEMDMKKFQVADSLREISSRDIYRKPNIGKLFVSIDMRQANFNTLKSFSSDIFNNKDSWEQFILQYTNCKHIVESKYVRQVIMGNCNPSRHITYEKYLMSLSLQKLIDLSLIDINNVAMFSNDEIIVVCDNLPLNEQLELKNKILGAIGEDKYRVEFFKLVDLNRFGYVKVYTNGKMDLKCVDPEFLPMILRKLKGEEISEFDKRFWFKGEVCTFLNIPEAIKNLKVEVPEWVNGNCQMNNV